MAPYTDDEITASGIMHPLFEAEIKRCPLPPSPPSATFQDLRAHRAQLLRDRHHLRVIPGPIPETVSEEDATVTARDGYEIPIRVYRPTKAQALRPLFVAFHEGGWTMGDLTDEETNCRLFARDLEVVCVNVDYRLGPAHPFPIGVLDCWDALVWSSKNAASIGANLSLGFVIGGASAGGNIAAALAHKALDDSLSPPVTGQFLCVPALLDPSTAAENLQPFLRSRKENLIDPVLSNTEGLNTAIMMAYKPDTNSPLYNVFNHPAGHAGLPRTYMQVAGLDPLRDEAMMYERELRKVGVETKLDLYSGYGHMFWMNFPELEMSKQVSKDTVQGAAWLFRIQN